MKEKIHSKLASRKLIFLLLPLMAINGFISACSKSSQSDLDQPQQISQKLPTSLAENDSQTKDETGKPKVYRDLAYGSISPSQMLDLYIPDGKGPFPLVLIIHGGGFASGDKDESSQMSKVTFLIEEGYAAASINYRLSDEAIYPAQIHDSKTAVRFLREYAGKYNLDSDRFGAWGASAGGTLAALLGTTCNVSELEGAKLGYADQSSCIQAAVDWFGPIDLLKMNAQFEEGDCPGGYHDADSAKSNESKWVGAPIQTIPELVAKTNPMNYIDPGDAPFYIQHGTDDCTIPPEQSSDFAKALTDGIGKEKVFYSELPGATHGGDLFKTDANLSLVGDFLNKFLK